MMVSEKTEITQDTFLIGIGASPGIAIGETFMLNRARMAAIERHISPEEVQAEIDAFLVAVRLSRKQLEEVKQGVTDRQLVEHLFIIDTHLLILEDQLLLDETISLIKNELLNAEGALKRTLNRFREVFDAIEDEYLRERRSDIDSVGDRILRNLMGISQQSLTGIDRKVVIVAHDLSPADTMQIDKDRIIGFLTDVGGRTSHTAILARSLGIPAIVGLESVTSLVGGGVPVIIDGSAGTVILNPAPETFKEYLQKRQAYEYLEKELLSYRSLAAETLDGCRVHLRGNIELAEEIPLALEQGAEGLGLFRTEFLFMNRPSPPTEEEQLQLYREIVERMAPQPVTIRTLDVGGDKFVAEINLADEMNPALGLRAIRFSLKERRLFKQQLRAILRVSAFGRVRIMFPMISGVAEIRACRDCLEEARAELVDENISFDPELPVGIMIETPAAAMIAELLAKEVDFFSVGTNDLIQYCLAVDRGNEHVAYLYEPLHPAILRALRLICDAGRAAGIEVGMCGEMAGEPLYTLVLLGLGFTELSMNAPGIPRIKRILRQVRREEGERLLAELLELATAREVTQRLEGEMARRFPALFGAPLI
jgi:phosphoenolpyruvate-protein phosphotransferase (PTS system enzyme I)